MLLSFIFQLVSFNLCVIRVSKLSLASKEDRQLNKKAKNSEVGKLTEADNARTGRVGKGLTFFAKANGFTLVMHGSSLVVFFVFCFFKYQHPPDV